MKIRASKGVKAVSLKEYDDSEGGSANEIDRCELYFVLSVII